MQYTSISRLIHLDSTIFIHFQDKKTPLHLSARRGHKDTCTLLIRAHADVNAIDKVTASEEEEEEEVELRKREIARKNNEKCTSFVWKSNNL